MSFIIIAMCLFISCTLGIIYLLKGNEVTGHIYGAATLIILAMMFAVNAVVDKIIDYM